MDDRGKARPGGRSARVVDAVLSAAFQELVAAGADQFSVNGVAARAGVHPTSIYRRWKTREALALAAWLHFSQANLPIPDTGTLAGDLTLFLQGLARILRSPEGRAGLRLMQSEDRGIAAARRRFWDERFAAASIMFERAAARGEIETRPDYRTAVELAIAPLYLRALVTGEPPEPLPAEEMARVVAAGLSAGRR